MFTFKRKKGKTHCMMKMIHIAELKLMETKMEKGSKNKNTIIKNKGVMEQWKKR